MALCIIPPTSFRLLVSNLDVEISDGDVVEIGHQHAKMGVEAVPVHMLQVADRKLKIRVYFPVLIHIEHRREIIDSARNVCPFWNAIRHHEVNGGVVEASFQGTVNHAVQLWSCPPCPIVRKLVVVLTHMILWRKRSEKTQVHKLTIVSNQWHYDNGKHSRR